jgi:predicted nucleic acid-binding protein
LAFAHDHPDDVLGVPWVVLGEFWHGAIRAGHDRRRVEAFLMLGIPLMDPTPIVPRYAQLCAELQGKEVYRSIGQNDLWIASIALVFDKPLVSRNNRHFEQIDGLSCMSLADSA